MGNQLTTADHVTAKHRFGILLVALVLMLFGQVFLTNRLEGVLGPVLFTLVLLAALATVTGTRRRKAIAIILAIPASGLLVAATLLRRPELAAAGSAVTVAFLGYAVAAILDFVFSAQRVDKSVIMGALCVYILLTVIWGELYGLEEVLRPGSFKANLGDPGAGTRAVLQYFSFVTITTVGYGDIYPVSPLARATAATEALIGQLYLVVLVARLVGLHTAEEAAARRS